MTEVSDGVSIGSIWDDMPYNNAASKEIAELLGNLNVFDTPKPQKLLEEIIRMGSKESDIILDFFAGSGTLNAACYSQNIADGDRRRCISVQLPEPTPKGSAALKSGYNTISDLAIERIRRAAAKIKEEHPDYEGDLGFRVFKLDSSNIKAWNAEAIAAAQSDDEQAELLNEQVDHLLADRTEDDILYELLLKLGLDLCVPIEPREIAGKTVYSVGAGVLMVCLSDAITYEDSEPLAQGIVEWHREFAPSSDTQVFFRDSAFSDDVSKTNMAAILEQNGINHVRSL